MTVERFIETHFDYTYFNITVDMLCTINEMFESGMSLEEVLRKTNIPSRVVHYVRNGPHFKTKDNLYLYFDSGVPVVSHFKRPV